MFEKVLLARLQLPCQPGVDAASRFDASKRYPIDGAFVRIYVPECISWGMDAASRFSSDLFEPASSHWLPRQQQARAQDTPLGRGSNPGGGPGPPSEIPWIPGGGYPPGSAPKRVTLGPPLGPVAWMWMTYPDRNFGRFFVLTSHPKLQNPPRSYRT